MLANISVEQALIKAKSHENKGELAEAQKLYETILRKFSNNLRAQQGLAALNRSIQNNVIQHSPQELVDQLVNLYNQGQFQEVAQQAKPLTKQYPSEPVVWNIFGASSSKIGMLDVAVDAYKKAILLKPQYSAAYNNMGMALKDQGKFNEAIDTYQKAIILNPNDGDIYFNMGIALKDQGKLEESIKAYKKAISLKPNKAQAYNNLGIIFKDQDKMDEAIDAYKKAISIKPDYAEAYSNMGVALRQKGALEESIDAYKKAISIKPDYAEAYNNMGLVFIEQGKLIKAINAFDKSISLNPNYAEAYNNMGNAFEYQNNFEKAIELYKKALAFKTHDYRFYFNLGNTLNKLGKLEEAKTYLKKSISLKPDYAEAHQNLGFILLNNSHFKEGFEAMEWRWKTPKFLPQQRHFPQPKWDGTHSLNDKRILIWCEQGVGDTINWSSCLPFVISRAEHCILECQDKLVPLLTRSFPEAEVKAVDRSRDKQRDDFDIHLPMGSLYKHFIDEIIENDKPDAYLVPDPDRVTYWKDRLKSLGKGPYIGISWKSSNMSPERLPNYSSISEWSPILKIPDVTFINLQYKDFAEDVAQVREELGVTVHNFDDLDQFNDVDDVAALCAALDMVVSNKTTAPLISAGVGTVTKLANWGQSPWNNILHNPVGSSVDIYEKDTLEPWDNVFKSIKEDISEHK